MDSATYRHVMGQTKKSCSLPHNAFPSHNLVSLETLLGVSKDLNSFEDESENFLKDGSQILNDFPCYKQFHYKVQAVTALHCGSVDTDAAADLVKKKLNWEKKLKVLRVTNVEKAVKCIKRLKRNEPTNLSSRLIQYIEHFHNDPEPMFWGHYNWLYTGGNIVDIKHGNKVFLISADNCDNKPGFNVLQLNESLNEVENKLAFQVKKNLPLLQISCKTREDNSVIFTRQKNYASLFVVKNANEFLYPEKVWSKKTIGSKLLTYIDINGNCKEVLVSDSNHDVHIFDIEMKSKTYGCSIKQSKIHDKMKNTWNQVWFGDNCVYIGLRNCFCFVDTRDASKNLKLLYTPSLLINNCEEISSIMTSKLDSNYVYLATTHSLIQLDVRNGNAVQRWTHLMNNPPQFTSCIKDDDSEFFILQSHQINETLGFSNDFIQNGDDANFFSRSLPCLLRSAKESLKLARFNGLCLSPYVSKRFDYTVTGIHCLKTSDGDIHLFTENSGGDIFLSKIKKSIKTDDVENETEREILNSMKHYESQFMDHIPKKAHCPSMEFVNMKDVLADLKKSKFRKNKYERPDIDWKYHEKFAPESLVYYKDVLAKKILQVWGFEPESELDDATMSSEAKVREWMEKI